MKKEHEKGRYTDIVRISPQKGMIYELGSVMNTTLRAHNSSNRLERIKYNF